MLLGSSSICIITSALWNLQRIHEYDYYGNLPSGFLLFLYNNKRPNVLYHTREKRKSFKTTPRKEEEEKKTVNLVPETSR